MNRWSCFFELGSIPLNLLIYSSVMEMWWQGKENNMMMYWFLSYCCDTLFWQYQCKAERVYFNSQFQEQSVHCGGGVKAAEGWRGCCPITFAGMPLSSFFPLAKPRTQATQWMVPPIADRPSHLNLHNQDYLPQTHTKACFPGDSRLKFTINPNHQR